MEITSMKRTVLYPTPDVDWLVVLADKVPYVNIFLARMCRDMKNDALVASCLLKADQQGFLGRRDASWLLMYNKNGGNDLKVKTYMKWAKEASDKANLRKRRAEDARGKAQLRMRWANDEMKN